MSVSERRGFCFVGKGSGTFLLQDVVPGSLALSGFNKQQLLLDQVCQVLDKGIIKRIQDIQQLDNENKNHLFALMDG